MTSHWIPPFTQQTKDRGRQQRAICGIWIAEREFSTEPTCPACSAWLMDDEAALDGLRTMEMDPVHHVDFDTTAGYHERRKR